MISIKQSIARACNMYNRRYNRGSFYKRSDPAKFDKAAEMRNNLTRAEAKMYEILYSEVVPKYPQHIFYRQSVQFGYILDFYCPSLRLGIEVDGATHCGRESYDTHRDAVLGRHNIQVFRFNNDAVLYNPHVVASRLCQIVGEKNSFRGFIPAPAYGTTVGTTLQKEKSSYCFIATAAYGTPMAQEINTLRRFRDSKMEPNVIGRELVYLYYSLSPPLARIITRSKNMKAFVRMALKPIIRSLELS